MRSILKITGAIVFFALTTNANASIYNTHKSLIVNTIPLNYELAVKVIPVVRTFISANGHIAHVKGSNQIVVVSSPETYRILDRLLSTLTLNNFNKQDLKQKLKSSKENLLTTKMIKLHNLNAQILIPALRKLVSVEGSLEVESRGQIKIRDYPTYIDGMMKLIEQLDTPLNEDV